MPAPAFSLNSSVGRKLAIAISGAVWIGFLVAHLAGNLYVFAGRDALNSYAAWVQHNPLLWPARVALGVAFGVHVGLAIALARGNRRARGPRRVRSSRSALPSFVVAASGAVVLAFVVFHLLHFTLGVVQPAAHALVEPGGRHDVYGMVIAGFTDPWIALGYVVAMTLIGVHLAHGATSMLQTLGLLHGIGDGVLRVAANGLVAAVVLGNLAIPISVQLGWIGGGA